MERLGERERRPHVVEVITVVASESTSLCISAVFGSNLELERSGIKDFVRVVVTGHRW